ncbi:MAG: beta-ketoacyl synthase N-terminal-like domain-containing protein [Rivularia sp. (in: cyanobacteria)]
MINNNIGTALIQFHKQIDDCEQALLELIKVKKMTSERSVEINRTNKQLQQTPIAIIGMGSLFPQAKNLQEYWETIIGGVDCITDVPVSRWSIEDYYHPDPKTPDKTYCKRGGFIPEVDFNPMEFGLPPNQLEVTDISQLLGLVVAKQAFCDAGYDSESGFNHDRTGVILGVALARQLTMPLAARLQYPVWEKVLKSSGLSDKDTQNIIEKIKSAYINWDTNAFPGMLANIVAGRIANRFDLGGTNCVVDAACASSLSALSMAISELVEYRADMMLTGGVDTDNSIVAYMCFSKTPAVSPSENVKPFDAESDGMMLGEGIGMLVLKRLEDAERDNDRIYAVIKGVGTSSDGRHKSIYAPRAEGQVKALERAYQQAGFTPQTVGLIEAHGTGTMAGDPAEFAALKAVFSQDNFSQSIALGSVKSQIGHTKAAAGAASLIKTALALHHKVLPPTINVTQPNPKLEIESSPFYLNTQTRPWLQVGNTPRRAGVSSFGFGGTNFHIVLEEYHTQDQVYRIHRTPQELLLFAPTPEQLLGKCESAIFKLKSDKKEEYYKELIGECKSVQIPLTAARLGFVADGVTETIKKLQICIDWLKKQPEAENWQHPQGVYYRKQGMELQGKVVALFSGQGSQYLEMGRELAINFPLLQQTYHQVDSLFEKAGLSPISEKVFPPPVFDTAQRHLQAKVLQQTEVSQPAIGAFSVGLYKLLQQSGFKPDIVAGHSFGELTALWAASVFSDEDYFYLVKQRGQAMAKPDNFDRDTGSMLAVKGNVEQVKAILKDFPQVIVANCNSPQQVVLAGTTDKVNYLQQVLIDKGFSAISLPVSGAFHTPLISYAQKPFAIAVGKVTFNSPKIAVFTNTTATVYPQESEAIKRNLQAHIGQSVLFEQQIENIYNQGGYCFVEFGPRSILTNLVHEILGSRPHMAIALNGSRQKDSDCQLREAVVQLRVAGLPLKNLDPHQLELKLTEVKSNPVLNVKLGSFNYVSEKTKAVFTQELLNGQKNENLITASTQVLNGNGYKHASKEKLLGEKAIALMNDSSYLQNGHSVTAIVNEFEPWSNGKQSESQQSLVEKQRVTLLPVEDYGNKNAPDALNTEERGEERLVILERDRSIACLESSIEQFSQVQSQTLEVHGQYLDNQKEYVQSVFQLMQQQNTLFSNIVQSGKSQPVEQIIASVERSMMRVHEHQADTLHLHKKYLQAQVESTQNVFELTQQGYSHLFKGNGIQSDKGHPELVLDSVITENNRREQVMIEQSIPVAVAAVEVNQNGSKIHPISKNNGIVDKTENIPEKSLAINVDTLSKTLLSVVSDKTGYPLEMLELEMDIEADLGIDSIKRVEIIGGLQEQLPNLPQPNLEEMAEVELRTLGQIVDYMQGLKKEDVEKIPSLIDQELKRQNIQTESNGVLNKAEIENEKQLSVIDKDTLGKTLLMVVSEKTGYPGEMLDLEMDIEADLGIDSIKRVEIIGGLQEQLPDLPQPNLEEMAEIELRTLGQIVDYIKSLTTETEKKKQPSIEPIKPKHHISRTKVKQQFLPKPDKLDFDLPFGHICLLTDDGSQLTGELAQTLKDKGLTVVVMNFPQSVKSSLPLGIERITLENGSDEEIKTQLSTIKINYGEIAAFMHLHPVNQTETAIIKQVFLLAKHLKTSLTQAGKLGRSCFMTVTRLDGELGCSGKNQLSAITGGLFGLTKSLRWEWQSVFCRAIDLSPDFDTTIATQHILAEFHDPNRLISEVGYGKRGRMTIIS